MSVFRISVAVSISVLIVQCPMLNKFNCAVHFLWDLAVMDVSNVMYACMDNINTLNCVCMKKCTQNINGR